MQMAQKVGERLKHDPLKLRFTQSNGHNGAPKTIVRRQNALTVAELISPGYMSSTNNLLYYELLDISIVELETKKSLRITWVGPNNKEDVSSFVLHPEFHTLGLADVNSVRRCRALMRSWSPRTQPCTMSLKTGFERK
jgi:ubiquitin carboxyl-terminal hydrolase 7